MARAGQKLGVDASTLTLKDSVVRHKTDPRITVAAADLLDGKSLRMHGETKLTGHGRALVKGVGACFVEVEVDTWTGQFRVTRVVYSHDTGKLLNPTIAIADQEGSFMQSFQVTTNSIPYDKEFPGQVHNNIAFLSFPIPTIMEFPDDISQVFIESLEPRWFYGYKGFSETAIGGVPGAIANAIYNATGVRVSHPVTAARVPHGSEAAQRGLIRSILGDLPKPSRENALHPRTKPARHRGRIAFADAAPRHRPRRAPRHGRHTISPTTAGRSPNETAGPARACRTQRPGSHNSH